MKPTALAIALTVTCCLAASASPSALSQTAAIAASDATHGSLAGCVGKITKIKGHMAVENCGPATATLRAGGKTHTFKNGTCAIQANGLPLVQLGIFVQAKNNGGYTDFQLEGLTKDDTTVSANSGSFHLSALVGKASGNGTHGNITFSGHSSSVTFSGSVNCHGVVRKDRN